MTGKHWEQTELVLDLAKEMDPSIVRVGFLNQWNSYSDKVVAEPSYVHMMWKNGTKWEYLCELKPIHDDGYNISATVVYMHNFLRINDQEMVIPELNNSKDKSKSTIDQNISKVVDNFNYPRKVKRVKFIIGRPKVSFQETISNLRTKSWNNITVGVSFVSIMGPQSKIYDIETLHMSYKYNYVLKTLCHILGKNFNCMQQLMKSKTFVSKVKPVFKIILSDYLEKFLPTLVNFAKNNVMLGDWIMGELLDTGIDSTSASLLAQVILSNK